MHQIEGFVIKKEVVRKPNKCMLTIKHISNEYVFHVPPKKMALLVEIDKQQLVRVHYNIENNILTLIKIENLTN